MNCKGGLSICPFYQTQQHHLITCEGTDRQNQLLVRFATEKALEGWQDRYCLTFDYLRCPLAQLANQKYNYISKGELNHERIAI